MRTPILKGDYTYVVALPARDEAERIVRCLDACRLAMRQVSFPGAIALLVNNTTDETADLARAWSVQMNTPLFIHEACFPAHLAHAGSARRAAFDLARTLVHEDGFILTTDADTVPSTGWVAASLSPLIAGEAAMVCGAIQIDPEEARCLPDEIAARGEIEDKYSAIARELTNLIDPDPLNVWPFHGQESGASLAVTVAAYDLVGGLPVVPVAEDRAIARRFREHDLPIFYSQSAEVTTSCRLMGRAEGGMASTIMQRMAGGSHICDEALEPAHKVRYRARLRARLRGLYPDRQKCIVALSEVGLNLQGGLPGFSSFGALWTFVEDRCPYLVRRPMTWEQMYHELPALEAMRNTALSLTMSVSVAAASRCKV